MGSSLHKLWIRNALNILSISAVVQAICLFNSLHCVAFETIPGPRYYSSRGLGMGRAFAALADTPGDALMVNPAAIARLRKFTIEPVNLQLQLDDGMLSNGGLNMYKTYSLDKIKTSIVNGAGANLGGSLTYFPTISIRGIAVGMLYENYWMANLDPNTGLIRYRPIFRLIPTAGIGLRLAQGVFRIGYSFQYVNQAYGDVQKSASETLTWGDGIAEGSGMSHTASAALTIPYKYIPSLTFVAHNIGNTKYTTASLMKWATNSTGAPATDPMSFDLGLSFSPKLTGAVFSNIEIDYRDILEADPTWTVLSRLSMGLELVFGRTFSARTGWGSGGLSLGFGFKTTRADLSGAWYLDEIGRGSSDKDRRFLFQIQVAPF